MPFIWPSVRMGAECSADCACSAAPRSCKGPHFYSWHATCATHTSQRQGNASPAQQWPLMIVSFDIRTHLHASMPVPYHRVWGTVGCTAVKSHSM